MKKIILSVIIVISFALSTKAQTGSILVYGNVGIASSSSSDNISGGSSSKETNSSLNLGLGYQFNSNWTGGLNFQYAYENSNGVLQQYMIDPFIRYAKPISSIFSIYGQFQAGYSRTSFSPNPDNERINGFNAQIFPAVFVNIKNGFGLNFNFGGIQYNSGNEKDDAGNSSSSKAFSFTFGQGINFGISKNFGGKSHS
ncbi:MAG TPA: outer membrane beta-barrel protein [Puia sp.]|jgi:opacity protein-like surface antigen|nr:outer membrane beta-barrel protein [Puia sp.]